MRVGDRLKIFSGMKMMFSVKIVNSGVKRKSFERVEVTTAKIKIFFVLKYGIICNTDTTATGTQKIFFYSMTLLSNIIKNVFSSLFRSSRAVCKQLNELKQSLPRVINHLFIWTVYLSYKLLKLTHAFPEPFLCLLLCGLTAALTRCSRPT